MAQTLYYNGTILTMEDRCPQVEAVLTEDGRILETGTWEKVKERAGDKARRLDLQGKGDDAGLYRFPQPFYGLRQPHNGSGPGRGGQFLRT